MYTDRIDLSIPQEDLQSVLSDIASAAATLEFLPFINPSDRKHLAKLGLKNEGLARRIIELGRANPGLLPRDMDFEKVDRDLLARDQLWELKLVLEKLLGRVSDALMLTGVDLYAAALEMYHCLRRHDDEPGLRDLIDDVKKGFSRPSRKKKQESAAAAAETPVISAPEPVAQVPAPEPVAPERAPERRAPAVHISTQPRPHIFSGGFAPSALVYVNRDLPQHHPDGFLASYWRNGGEGSDS